MSLLIFIDLVNFKPISTLFPVIKPYLQLSSVCVGVHKRQKECVVISLSAGPNSKQFYANYSGLAVCNICADFFHQT